MDDTAARLTESVSAEEAALETLKDAGFFGTQKKLRQAAPAPEPTAATMAQVMPPVATSGDATLPGAGAVPLAGPIFIEQPPAPAPAPLPADAPLTSSAKKKKRKEHRAMYMAEKRAADPELRKREAEARKQRRVNAAAKRAAAAADAADEL